jgi:micrococcal nuclease
MPLRPLFPRALKRLTRRLERDLAFFCASFTALFAIAVTAWPAFAPEWRAGESVAAVSAGALLFITLAFWRPLWHALANRLFLGALVPLSDPWVIDGDTIDDRAGRIRYRLANIDAPEIDGAKCYREAERGQLAKWAFVRIVREAKSVVVRPTFRVDRYGRRVGFVLADGVDVGETLIARGLAVRWGGVRRRWCGPHGGLAKLARAGAMAHRCQTCRAFT